MALGLSNAKVILVEELISAGGLHAIQTAWRTRTTGKDHAISGGEVNEFLSSG